MASPLQPISINAPSFFGLNTQDSSVALPPEFALLADNCVIDRFGRIGARKGVNQFSDTQFPDPIRMMHEHILKDATKEFYIATGAEFYSVAVDGTTTLEYTHPTATDSNWQPLSFNGDFYAFQEGEQPVFHHITAGHSWELIGGGGAHNTLPVGVNWFGTASAVYGRIWAARTNIDKQIVYYSDTLIGHDFTTGASGALSLETVFPNGTDEITHIAGFNGFLVIFCRNCIIIYSGAEDPSSMQLADVIDGVGCIARDSVQDIGTDLLFLSSQGLRSLQRVIQEKSLPQRDMSKNVRDSFLVDILGEPNPIKTVYSPRDAFYLVALNSTSRVYCFDIRTQLEDGSARVTTWSGITPTAFATTRAEEVLHIATDGWVTKYENYADLGQPYEMSYLTGFLDAGNSSVNKILKEVAVLLLGGSEDQVNLRYEVDYGTNYREVVRILPLSSTAEYGIAEYDIAEYSQGQVINRLKYNIGKVGQVFQIGLTIEVFSDPISIQQLSIFFKQGRLI